MTRTSIVIDLRCLQEPMYLERGISGHARNVILRARQVSRLARDARLVGIADLALPTVEADVADALDEIRPNGYFPGLPAGSVFLNPSPMTPDQSFAARLLMNRDLHKAVLVHDFIPYEHQQDYLNHPAPRLDYMTSMAWLNRYDVFLCNSSDTQSRLRNLFAVRNRPCFVTGAPLPAWLDFPSPAEPRHILIVSGQDARKNPEVLIRAHACSRQLQAARIPLVIAGMQGSGQAEAYRELARQRGGDPGLLNVTGKVTDDALLALYRQAICVVTTSRAEGFSMPVVEAMAAGVASIASDIPAHAALVKDAGLRFHPDDDAALALLLERIAGAPEFRAAIIAGQAGIWPPFRAEAVAKAVWSGIEASLPRPAPQHFCIGGRRPRVAMLTPLPPARSGVADFSAVCAPSLEKLVDLSLFAPPAQGRPGLQLHPAPYGTAHLAKKFDRVVSVLGNSPYHDEIYDLHTRYGSACICHDSRLLDFFSWKYGAAFAAGMASRELGRQVDAAEIQRWLEDETKRKAGCFGDLAATARPMIFHSKSAAASFHAHYGVAPRTLKFAIDRPWTEAARTAVARQTARRSLGFAEEEFTIISLGFVLANKGLAAAIQAMALLVDAGVNARLIWVGEADCDLTPWLALAASLGIGGRVNFGNEFVTEPAYRRYLQAADCGLQLRIGGSGNISGALQDCIAAGLPAVANEDLASALDAPSYVTRVADTLDPRDIASALTAIRDRRPDTEPECAAYTEDRSMDAYARGLCEILEL